MGALSINKRTGITLGLKKVLVIDDVGIEDTYTENHTELAKEMLSILIGHKKEILAGKLFDVTNQDPRLVRFTEPLVQIASSPSANRNHLYQMFKANLEITSGSGAAWEELSFDSSTEEQLSNVKQIV